LADYHIKKSEKLPKVKGRNFSAKMKYLEHWKTAKKTNRKITFK
tara:strand:+ start:680 stop:811 length:132 start_codon:yes stop_codon:yes gene_type:complete